MKKYCGVDLSVSMLDAAKIMTTALGVDSIFYERTGDVLKR